MSKFVENANLPRKVEKLIVGKAYREFLDESLRSLEIEPIYCPSNPDIDERLSGHCDLSVLHERDNTVFLAPYLKNSVFSAELERTGCNTLYPQVNMGEKYPEDSRFNLCLLKNTFFYSPKVSSINIVDHLISNEMKPIAIKQGYCRCSTCIVNERSIITSDTTVYQRALVNDMDCLLISPGYISLEGFDYGFIGGSSFKISDDQLCFTGNINKHPDKESILAFLKKHHVYPVFLTDLPIFDIGSAVPLTEK